LIPIIGKYNGTIVLRYIIYRDRIRHVEYKLPPGKGTYFKLAVNVKNMDRDEVAKEITDLEKSPTWASARNSGLIDKSFFGRTTNEAPYTESWVKFIDIDKDLSRHNNLSTLFRYELMRGHDQLPHYMVWGEEEHVLDNYNMTGGFISINLKEEYKKYKFKDCFLIYLLNYLKFKRFNKRVYNDFSQFPKYLKSITNGGYRSKGLNLFDISDHLNLLNVSYYAVNDMNEIILSNKAINSLYIPLIFAIHNNHVYPVIDKDKRLSISRRLNSGFIKHKDPKNTTYVRELLDKELDEFLEKGIVPKNLTINGKCVKLGNKLYKDYDVEICKKICGIMNKEISTSIFDIFNLDNYPVSTLNTYLRDLFSYSMKGGKNIVLKDYCPSKTDHHLDFRGMYSYCLSKAIKTWGKFLPMTQIKKFTRGSAIYYNGRYFVKTKDKTLFNGSNHYSGFIIKEAIENNIEFECQYCVEPEVCYKNNGVEIDYFLFNEKMANIPYKDMKDILNKNIGNFNKHFNRFNYSIITDDINTCKRLFYEKDARIFKHDKYKNIYKLEILKKNEILTNRRFIYYDIIDMAYLLVYQKLKEIEKTGREILEIKTDCIIYRGKKLDYKDKSNEWCRKNFGTWEHEDPCLVKGCKKLESFPEHYDPFDNIEKIDFFYRDENNCFLITGRAGTSKSTVLTQLYEDKFIYKYPDGVVEFLDKIKSACSKHSDLKKQMLSYTNCAARNIKGKTLISYFGKENIKKSKVDFKAILSIDEIYMCTLRILEFLYVVMYKNKGIPIIAAGDPHQLTMGFVNKISDKKMIELIYYLFYNKIELIIVYRYDKKLEDNTDPKDPNYYGMMLLESIPIEIDFRHITHTNKTKDKINKLYKDQGLDRHPKAPYISKITKKSKNDYDAYAKN